MQVLIGDNFYRDIKIWWIKDSTHRFILEYIMDYAVKYYQASYNPIAMVEPVERYLEPFLMAAQPGMTIRTVDPTLLKWENVRSSENWEYGQPGFIYIRASINELRGMRNSDTLLFNMKTPDDRFVAMSLQLRQLGYGIMLDGVFGKTDHRISDAMLNLPCDWLVTIPGPSCPGDIDMMDYISTDCIISYVYGSGVSA